MGVLETVSLGCFSFLLPAMAHAKTLGKVQEMLAVVDGKDSLFIGAI